MASSNSINVVEHSKIFPASGAPTRMSMPLNVFDLIWLPVPSVQRLFFYELSCSTTHFRDSIIPNLKTSLSLTLNHFFPLAGNLTWPTDSTKPEILYVKGDSLSFTACESEGDFDNLASNHARSGIDLYPLAPQLLMNMSGKREFPVAALQVTLFPNKGICIGITYGHTVGDGKVIIEFIKSWASISSDASFLADMPPLCYDRSLVNDPYGTDMSYLDYFKKAGLVSKDEFSIPNDSTPTDKVLATFTLTSSHINKLKALVAKEHSTFAVTCAYAWVCWIKVRSKEEDEDNTEDDPMEYFVFPIDCRRRLDPPLPPRYFGNCLNGGLAECRRSDLVGEYGVAIAAEAIRNAIEICSGKGKILKFMETFISRITAVQPGRLLSVSGSPRFGVYQIDFGWGNPKKAEISSIVTTGAICLTDCPNEPGAVQVSFGLNTREMEAFSSLFRL